MGALDLANPGSTRFLSNQTSYSAIKDAHVVQRKEAPKVIVTWVLANGETKVTMMNYNLKSESAKVTEDQYELIVPQPLSLLLVRKNGADIFKLNSLAMNPRN